MDIYWQDTLEINRVVNSYFRALDEKTFEPALFASIFWPDGRVNRPNGTALIGPQEIADSHVKSFARFKATQHVLTGHDVSINGDMAHVRVNLVAVHLWQDELGANEKNMLGNHFTAGTVITAELHRTGNGWRIRWLDNVPVWRDGVGLENMANTDK